LFQLSPLEALLTAHLSQLGCRSTNARHTNNPQSVAKISSRIPTHSGFGNNIDGKVIRSWNARNYMSERNNPSANSIRLNMGLGEETHLENTDAKYLYETIDENYDDVTIGDGNDDDNSSSIDHSKRKLIQISSQIELPFSAEVAYDAYSNLPRQPSWSSWLESVVVLNDRSDRSTIRTNEKVESKWTSKIMGIRYSWTAEAVQNERPHTIQWKSVTGLRNEGIVRFHHSKGKSYSQGPTLMTLQMIFVTPRAATSILRRSKRLSRFVEEQMIARSLQEFRDIVLENDVVNAVETKTDTATTTSATTTV